MASQDVSSPQTELGRLLSPSTLQTEAPLLRKIGSGTCGSVVCQEGTRYIFKLQKHESDSPVHDLFNDFKMHNLVLNGLKSVPAIRDGVKVPYLSAWTPSGKTDFWEQYGNLFSAADPQLTVPCNSILAQRVLPLSSAIRRGLIDTFCPLELREKAHADPQNRNCLVRVYLGQRQQPKREGFVKKMFSLCNFQMNLDQMLQMGLSVHRLAFDIAGTLAALHWSACVDAGDVEFVLGASPRPTHYGKPLSLTMTVIETLDPKKYIGPEDLSITGRRRRRVGLWLIDFNLCKTITLDDSGVEAAIKAWKTNDPYFPRPLQPDKDGEQLWNTFTTRYLDISDEILKNSAHLRHLPRQFLRGIVNVERSRQSKLAEIL